MKIAFNYNLPILASNFTGFRDKIKFGASGYLFNINQVKDLMMKILYQHSDKYADLVNRMAKHTRRNYSPKILADGY